MLSCQESEQELSEEYCALPYLYRREDQKVGSSSGKGFGLREEQSPFEAALKMVLPPDCDVMIQEVVSPPARGFLMNCVCRQLIVNIKEPWAFGYLTVEGTVESFAREGTIRLWFCGQEPRWK